MHAWLPCSSKFHQLSGSRVQRGCHTLEHLLIYYSLSFLFHLVVCRDFYKYLNANAKKKKKKHFSFLLTHFLFWLVLWANPSAVILAVSSGGAPSAQPTCVISVTHEFLLMTSEPTKSWLSGLRERSEVWLFYLLLSVPEMWCPPSRACSRGLVVAVREPQRGGENRQ